MKKIKLNPNKGILFWITGLAGSGKTSIAKGIKSKIIKLYGPTIMFSGDDMRKIFGLKSSYHPYVCARLSNHFFLIILDFLYLLLIFLCFYI